MYLSFEVDVNVTDEPMLRAYTSGFMPAHFSTAQRVEKLLMLADHSLHPAINGVQVIHVARRASDAVQG